jgi:hypothetical protein
MQVMVETRLNLNPLPLAPEQSKEINWRNSSDRKWLMNHLHWAMHNNRAIELLPVSESL